MIFMKISDSVFVPREAFGRASTTPRLTPVDTSSQSEVWCRVLFSD